MPTQTPQAGDDSYYSSLDSSPPRRSSQRRDYAQCNLCALVLALGIASVIFAVVVYGGHDGSSNVWPGPADECPRPLPVPPLPLDWNATLPIFMTREDLRRSPEWDSYVRSVYGNASVDDGNGSTAFPLSTRGWRFFYYARLPPAMRAAVAYGPDGGVLRAPKRQDDAHSFWDWASYYHIPNATVWRYAYHKVLDPATCGRASPPCPEGIVEGRCMDPAPVAAPSSRIHRNGSLLIEVTHACCDEQPAFNATDGYWWYASPGSGVWLDLGRTVVFKDHAQAYVHFLGAEPWGPGSSNSNPAATLAVAERARRQGFDTVQYTHRLESGWYKHEIQDVRDRDSQSVAQNRTCPNRELSQALFTGLDASVPCRCVEGAVLFACNHSMVMAE